MAILVKIILIIGGGFLFYTGIQQLMKCKTEVEATIVDIVTKRSSAKHDTGGTTIRSWSSRRITDMSFIKRQMSAPRIKTSIISETGSPSNMIRRIRSFSLSKENRWSGISDWAGFCWQPALSACSCNFGQAKSGTAPVLISGSRQL